MNAGMTGAGMNAGMSGQSMNYSNQTTTLVNQ